MISICPLIFIYSSPSNNPLGSVPKVPITIGMIVTFMYHIFFQFPNKVQVLILLFTSFQFYSVVSRDSKVHNLASSPCFIMFFSALLIIISSDLLVEIRRSVCMSKSHRSLCIILLDRFWVVYIPFVRMVKFKFLAQLPLDDLAHPFCIVLYYFCANLLHSLIMWLTISFFTT